MTSVSIDILQKRVGAFQIDQEFPMPPSITDVHGCEIGPPEKFDIQPYSGVSVTFFVLPDRPGYKCRTIHIIVQEPTDVLLFGVPMPQASLRDVMAKLTNNGLEVVSNEDTVLVTTHATLGIFLDHIDMIALRTHTTGGDNRRLRHITDRSMIETLVNSAAAAPEVPQI